MGAIAGISGKGHREAVLDMLGVLRHRAKGPREVIDDEACTLGMIHAASPKQELPIFNRGPVQKVTAVKVTSRAYIDRGKLFLQRDRLGVTPLYYGFTADGHICFASEVKALLKLTRTVHELLPGTIFDGQTSQNYFRLKPRPHSDDPPDVLSNKLRKRLDRIIRQAASQDTMGAWLSGGIDSSTIVALARPYVKTLHTFVSGLAGAPDLEAARSVADFVKTVHHETVVSTQDLLQVLPEVIYYLESFDALLVRSSLTNFLAGRAARDYVSEVFSGEGGDELFAGYAYLKWLPKMELEGELIDITNRLHNTALQRVDRCASSHGLTPLVNFLDPTIVQFALRIPAEYKIRNGTEKWILRQAIRDLLPTQIINRPKAKFWEGAGVGERLAEHAEQRITDADFRREQRLPNGWTIASKEELMYYRIFRDHFGDLEDLDWMGRTKPVAEHIGKLLPTITLNWDFKPH
jgi:asparagine synthase (glutamine-hydrolysing)